MQMIVIATLVVGVIGLLIGIMLVAAGKAFYVETDERVALVRECLPGNNHRKYGHQQALHPGFEPGSTGS